MVEIFTIFFVFFTFYFLQSLHKKFNIPNTCGLSDIIIKKESLENAIQKYNKNLHILSSRKFIEKPASMLSSQAMDDILIALKRKIF